MSLAVLGDESPGWRPTEFGYALWDCAVSLRFPTVKLLDYAARWDELEASRNPFAVIVMAHIQATVEYEEEKQMPYVTSIERLGRQEGLQQGLQEGLQEGLQRGAREDVMEILRTRFTTVPPAIIEALGRIDDLGTLRSLLRRAITVARPEDLGLAA